MPVTRSTGTTNISGFNPAQENAMNRRIAQKNRVADGAKAAAVTTGAARRPLGARNASQPGAGFAVKGKSSNISNLPTAALQQRVIAKPARLAARPTNVPTTSNTTTIKPVSQEEVPSKPKSEATPKLQRGFSAVEIPDVDACDDNPLMVATYVNDIYSYLKQVELDQCINPDFLRGHRISARMRGVLVDWLVQVQIRFQLLPETLQMAIALVDRYLQAVDIAKDHLQLVGTTALFVAAKYEEIYPPEISDFSYITDNAFSVAQIREQERRILRKLDFNIGRPVPIHFLRRYSKAVDADSTQHMLAKYLIELSLVEYPLCQLRPSLAAAAASYLSTSLIPMESEGRIWMPILQHYSGYSFSDLKSPLGLFAKMLEKMSKATGKTEAVRRKYSSEKFGRIAQHSCLEEISVAKCAAQLPVDQ